MNVMQANFIAVCNLQNVNEILQDRLHEFPKDIEEALDEIFITYATLLMMNNKYADAFKILNKAMKIC